MLSLKDLKARLQQLFDEAQKAFQSACSFSQLYERKTKYMGLKSPLQALTKEIKNLEPEARPSFGKSLNEVKNTLETLYKTRGETLKTQEINQALQSTSWDFSLPGPSVKMASLHPVEQMMEKTVDIFKKLGFAVHTGPLIESDWNNFQALNIPPDHPARDEQDTFYIDSTHVLRTHTSPIQVRSMLRHTLPLACLAPGKVFRRDNDISHSPTFHQMEGMWIDKSVTMAHLKGLLSHFLREMFGTKSKVRFRPSYFPFTEPSAEYDCSCPICAAKGCAMCKQSGWVEIGGCGLIHPRVLKLSHIDPSAWEGLAFGLGMERLAIIYYEIPNIRLFFENQISFLEQF